MLSKVEPRIARICGYQLKMVEGSGRPLSNMFSKTFTDGRCHRICCPVCSFSAKKGPTRCQVKGVVYTCVCLLCDAKHSSEQPEQHPGIYVGETGRSLAERAKEHRDALRNKDFSSFMLKHWSKVHSDRLEPPDFRFSVTKKHKDALGRMVHEAVLIGSKATMNSKAEWMGYRVARLSVEMTDKEAKESVETSEGVDRHEKAEISALLARVATNCSPSTNSNPYFDSRKRSGTTMTGKGAKKSKVAGDDIAAYVSESEAAASAIVSEGKQPEGAMGSGDLSAERASLNETYVVDSPVLGP